MLSRVQVTVRGNAELKRKLNKMAADARGHAVDAAIMAGAKVLKSAIQAEVLANFNANRNSLLYKAILISKARSATKKGVLAYEVSSEVVNNIDWVHEYGATITPKRRPFLVFEINGELVFARKVVIPARPYFRPGIEKGRVPAHEVIRQTFVTLVIRANV